MAGKALVNFNDFVLATNERALTPPDEILNDATRNTYLYGDMLNQYSADETIQSGKKITDRVQFSFGSQFGFYQPNETFSPMLEDFLTNMEVNWRFAKNVWGWTDQEIELNVGDASGEARYTAFKKLKASKKQACTIATYEGMEDSLWATPSNSEMETSTGKRPYSIRAFITEDGLAPSGFTTVMGVNPSTQTRWRNQVSSYTAALIDVQLLPKMEEMWMKLRFRSPKNGEKAFTDSSPEKNKRKFLICTNVEGRLKYVQLTREANDNPVAAGRGDLGWALTDAQFGGIDVEPISALDNVGYAAGQPRFFWLNLMFMTPIMHSRRYLYEEDPMRGGITQPWTWVVYTDIWFNLFCRSRRRQGIIVPA